MLKLSRAGATASLHIRIDEHGPWANGLCSDGNDSSAPTGTRHVPTGTHHAPAGAGPPKLS